MPKKSAPKPTLITTMQRIPLELIDESPTNPRKRFDEAALADLAASIRSVGVQHPVLVRPAPANPKRFELVCGARRFRASKLAGVDWVPSQVKTLTDVEAFRAQFIENNQRKDITPLEEAAAVVVMRDQLSISNADISKDFGRPLAWVENRLSLGRLRDEFKALLEERVVGIGGALLLARVPEDRAEGMVKFLRDTHAREGRPLRESWISNRISDLIRELADAPFDVEDATLVAAAGACSSCPKRSGVQASLFGELTDDDRCLDVPCWDSKLEANWEVAKTDARRRRLVVIDDRRSEALRSEGYENADHAAWAAGEYGKKNRDVVKPDELVVARDGSGRVVELVPPDTIARLKDERAKRGGGEADDEDDEAPGLTDEERAERSRAWEEKERRRIAKDDEETLADFYPRARVEVLERLQELTAGEILRAFVGRLFIHPRAILLRRGLIAPGDSRQTEQAQLEAWLEGADLDEVAAALLEDFSNDYGEVRVVTADGEIVVGDIHTYAKSSDEAADGESSWGSGPLGDDEDDERGAA